MALLSSASHFSSGDSVSAEAAEAAEAAVCPSGRGNFPLTMGQSPAYRKAIVHADFHSVKLSPRGDNFGSDAGSSLNVNVNVIVG